MDLVRWKRLPLGSLFSCTLFKNLSKFLVLKQAEKWYIKHVGVYVSLRHHSKNEMEVILYGKSRKIS